MTTDISATRAAMGKRLGEIITAVIGDERIQKLMETVPHQQSDNAGIPTGEIALRAGVINAATRNGLLVAQSAERAYALAEQAEAIIAIRNESIRTSTPTKIGKAISDSDPVFKFVGSERDAPEVRYAQGVWMASQMLLNNEIQSVNGVIQNPGYVANSVSEGIEAVNGFKVAAVQLYRNASEILAQEGHLDAARKLSAVAAGLRLPAESEKIKLPNEVMNSLEWQFGKGGQDLAIVLSNDEYMNRQPIQDTFLRLAQLTTPPKTGGVPAEPKPPGSPSASLPSPKP